VTPDGGHGPSIPISSFFSEILLLLFFDFGKHKHASSCFSACPNISLFDGDDGDLTVS
jgi:hypothetical protein